VWGTGRAEEGGSGVYYFPAHLRRIRYRDPQTDKNRVFPTGVRELPAVGEVS
jgi:hypothetical protein